MEPPVVEQKSGTYRLWISKGAGQGCFEIARTKSFQTRLPPTRHKGFLGKCGFCRLGYWHWELLESNSETETWQRCHGAYVGRTPPQAGLLLTERHHPYHTDFNSFLLATGKCNHDVSVLVRAPGDAATTDAATFASMMAASTQLASYYITSYIDHCRNKPTETFIEKPWKQQAGFLDF